MRVNFKNYMKVNCDNINFNEPKPNMIQIWLGGKVVMECKVSEIDYVEQFPLLD